MSSREISLAPMLLTGTWRVDPERSRVGFSVRHMMVSTMRGSFSNFKGVVEIGNPDGAISAAGSVASASIDTDHADRDMHLQGDEFFAVDSFPEISFVSTAIELREGSKLRISGDLTMRDITNNIQIEGECQFPKSEQEDLLLTMRGQLDRKDFGLSWNQVIETGGVAVSDKVKLTLDLVLCKSDV